MGWWWRSEVLGLFPQGTMAPPQPYRPHGYGDNHRRCGRGFCVAGDGDNSGGLSRDVCCSRWESVAGGSCSWGGRILAGGGGGAGGSVGGGGCLLYTSDAADDLLCVDLGGRRII